MTSKPSNAVPVKGKPPRWASVVLAAALSLGGAGCWSTVIPQAVPPPAAAAFHGNVQNGGVLSVGSDGAVVDAGFMAKYDDAIDRGYGRKYSPPLHLRDGVSTYSTDRGGFLIDKEHLVLVLRMFDRMGNGEAP